LRTYTNSYSNVYWDATTDSDGDFNRYGRRNRYSDCNSDSDSDCDRFRLPLQHIADRR
jgi:hypothetical protein